MALRTTCLVLHIMAPDLQVRPLRPQGGPRSHSSSHTHVWLSPGRTLSFQLDGAEGWPSEEAWTPWPQ